MFVVKQVLFPPPLYGWRKQGLDIVTQRSDRPGIQSQVACNHHAVLPISVCVSLWVCWPFLNCLLPLGRTGEEKVLCGPELPTDFQCSLAGGQRRYLRRERSIFSRCSSRPSPSLPCPREPLPFLFALIATSLLPMVKDKFVGVYPISQQVSAAGALLLTPTPSRVPKYQSLHCPGPGGTARAIKWSLWEGNAHMTWEGSSPERAAWSLPPQESHLAFLRPRRPLGPSGARGFRDGQGLGGLESVHNALWISLAPFVN